MRAARASSHARTHTHTHAREASKQQLQQRETRESEQEREDVQDPWVVATTPADSTETLRYKSSGRVAALPTAQGPGDMCVLTGPPASRQRTNSLRRATGEVRRKADGPATSHPVTGGTRGTGAACAVLTGREEGTVVRKRARVAPRALRTHPRTPGAHPRGWCRQRFASLRGSLSRHTPACTRGQSKSHSPPPNSATAPHHARCGRPTAHVQSNSALPCTTATAGAAPSHVKEQRRRPKQLRTASRQRRPTQRHPTALPRQSPATPDGPPPSTARRSQALEWSPLPRPNPSPQ